MAASSTDAYSGNPNNDAPLVNNIPIPLFANYPVVSVTTGPNNFWPGDAPSSSTSPSSDHTWEVDEEEVIKRKIYELKRQFHNGRFLIVRHLPRDASEEDIRSLLNGHLVHSIQINTINGSARVLLAEPEVLESWGKSSQHILRGQKVTISPSNTEGLLCVARLPQDFLEEEFSSLVSSFGDVTFSFLMRSEKTGESKGYGFVEYVTKEVAMHAKGALDAREVRNDTTIVCEWLDPSHVTFASLHSTTLYVDRLPKDYRHFGEFRKIFSKVANPPYCQIAMMNGAIQNWGLVEFTSADEAEETRTLLNGFRLQGQAIRVSYYVPGVRAINIYMKLLNDPGKKNRGALLPEPPTNKVFTQLRNLTKHNPAFAKSLQNIILTQIQSLQQKPIPSPALGSNTPGPVVKGGRIIVPPPTIPLHLHLPPHLPPPPSHIQQPHSLQHPPPNISPPSEKQNNPLNSNAQAALIILLAAQLQQQQEQQNGATGSATSNSNVNGNNILSNPQILNLLQTLVSQGDPQQQKQQQEAKQQLQQQQQQQQQQHLSHQHHHQHPPRNGFIPTSSNGLTANTSTANILSSNLKNNFRNGYFKNGASKLLKGPLLPTPASSAHSFVSTEDATPPIDIDGNVAPILSDLLNGVKETPKEELTSSIATLLSNAQSLQHLLGSLNPEAPPVSAVQQVQPISTHSIPTSVAAHPPPPPPTLLAPPPMYQHSPATDPLMSLLLRSADTGRPEQYLTPVEIPPPFLLAPPRVPPPVVTSSWSGAHTPPPQALFHAPAVFPQQTALPPRLYGPTIYLTHGRSMAAPPSPVMGTPQPIQFGAVGSFTPHVGQKRKSSEFLPSSEPSENGYVGQHSQGIDGHYATKKIKKN